MLAVSLLAVSAVVGGAMPWRRRIAVMLSDLVRIGGKNGLVIGHPSRTAMALGAAMFIGGMLGPAIIAGGGAKGPPAVAGTPGIPGTPTIDVIVDDTSTWRITFSAFTGSGADTQDSIAVTVLRSGAADTLFHAISGAQTADTISDNTDLKADTTYRVLGRQKGATGGWSLADTVEVVNSNALTLTLFGSTNGAPDSTFAVGVPLRRGHVQNDDSANVALFYNGVEVKSRITPIRGRYPADSSVVSLRIQRKHHEAITASATITGYTLVFVEPDSTQADEITAETKDVPDALFLPPDDYYEAPVAGVWGPLVPVDEVASLTSSDMHLADSIYELAAEHRWTTLGEDPGVAQNEIEADNSWYDRAMAEIRAGVRGWGVHHLERGLRQAAVIRDFYLAQSPDCQNNFHRQNELSLGAAYWWTGVETYRTLAIFCAENWTDDFDGLPQPGDRDGRILGRQVLWLVQAATLDTLGLTISGAGFKVVAHLDSLVKEIIHAQETDGSWHSVYESGGEEDFQHNAMVPSMQMYALSLYLDYRGAKAISGSSPMATATIETAITDQADFMATQWDATESTWHYKSDWDLGDAEVSVNSMRTLALFVSCADQLAYGITGTAGYLTNVTSMLAMHVVEAPNDDVELLISGARKQFTEDHWNYQYCMAKWAGLPS